MLKKNIIILTLIISIIFLTSCINTKQDIYSTWESQKFDRTSIIALKYAKVALEEWDIYKHLRDFDLTKPFVTSNIAIDKDNVSHNVFLVIFPSKDNKSWANVYLPLNKDNYFDASISLGFSINSKEKLIEQITTIYKNMGQD